MPIILDHQLREQISHDTTIFPITYFHDEFAHIPNRSGPLHWHPDFEIATAKRAALDFQVGQQHIILEPGDSIFINGNVLHGIKQLSEGVPEPMPNIVFSGNIIAPEASAIYQKYIEPIIRCDSLTYILFKKGNLEVDAVNKSIENIYNALANRPQCYEMVVQRNLNCIFEYINNNFPKLSKSESTRIQINSQIRIQKMLSYIYEHYNETVTLEDIANSANISRSEAGRCFKTYMNRSPIDVLIQYRLQIARRMLEDKTLTLQEVSFACGFNSVNYFSRQFKKFYGVPPRSKLGK